ncbi:hypothetical protein ACFVQB_19325 [Paenibacillus sp. NPDC057886]|uniref:hypothetical protein n=1 Tax=Paenibacillus sp. NPDC057886 TaxID=3346270 RepID=UPI0036AB5E68
MLKRPHIRQSIFVKFSLAFLVVGLILLTVLSFMTLSQSSRQFERQTNNHFRQVVYQISSNVNEQFKSLNEASMLMYFRTDSALSSLEFTHLDSLLLLGRPVLRG